MSQSPIISNESIIHAKHAQMMGVVTCWIVKFHYNPQNLTNCSRILSVITSLAETCKKKYKTRVMPLTHSWETCTRNLLSSSFLCQILTQVLVQTCMEIQQHSIWFKNLLQEKTCTKTDVQFFVQIDLCKFLEHVTVKAAV